MTKFSALLVSLFLVSASITIDNVSAFRRIPNSPIQDKDTLDNDQDGHRRLLGGNVNVPTPDSPADHEVHNLPMLEDDIEQWAGLLPASKNGDKYLFYWLFGPEGNTADINNQEDIPLIIWLNGGPACSSMDGLFLENGPFRFVKADNGSWKMTIDPYSWHKLPAYVVYIDQPVGTGIAFTTSGKYPTNDAEVNIDFYYFLQQFLKLHADKFVNPHENRMSRPLYFSGESHAGHYIPSMMNFIRKRNHDIKKTDDSILIQLAGAAIGNGWFDPYYQYSAHEAAYGIGMIGQSERNALEAAEVACQSDLKARRYTSSTCFNLLDQVVDNSQGGASGYKVSQYDNRLWQSKTKPRDFPPGHKTVENYLGGRSPGVGDPPLPSHYEDVLAAINSLPSKEAGQRYQECTNPPYNALKHQDGLGVTDDIIELLNDEEGSENGQGKIRLLFFNGINDFICNHVGNEIALRKLKWKHQSEYIHAKRYGWKSSVQKGKDLSGYMIEYQNLQYLKILNSGHMVPMDLPDVAFDMMKTFVHHSGNFLTYGQELKRSTKMSHCPVCPNENDGNDLDGHGNDNDDTECPIDCSECDATSSTEAEASLQKSLDQVPKEVKIGMAFGIIAAFFLGILCCTCCRSSSRSSFGSTKKVLTKDMEMANRPAYRDNDDDSDDDGDDKEIPPHELT